MKKESQLAIAVHLRAAVWNWIDIFPHEFNEAIRTRGKMEGAPERVFDLLYSMVPTGSEKIFWPTLIILNCITFDRISPDFQYSTHKARKVGVFHFFVFQYTLVLIGGFRNLNSRTRL